MTSDPGLLEPRQERSRQTLSRLLGATIRMLGEHGLAATTIPRIAEAAGVAPATIYRRFRDRDALFRAAFLYALESSTQANRGNLKLEHFENRTLAGVIEALAAAVLAQFRSHGGIMKSLIRFIENDTDETFRRKALEINAANFEPLVELLLNFKDEITHADPRRAILFALLTMGTIVEERALESVSMWHELLPVTDDEIKPELVRLLLAYLTKR